MTICASVKVRDGIILGTDSMTQIWGKNPAGNLAAIKSYGNAAKLFRLGQTNIGVMTYGIGNLGPRSVQGLMRDFSKENADSPSVKSTGQQLYRFFSEEYHTHVTGEPLPGLGFFIAGYSPGEPFPDEWEFLLPRDEKCRQVRPADQFGASWRGVEIPFTRLYKGYDPRMLDELVKQGVKQEVLKRTVQTFESPVVYDGMPVQDAVNFLVFILQTTVGLASFEVGVPSCGGPLQVATILPEQGFQWISQLSPTLP
jgi:hypothetical protein